MTNYLKKLSGVVLDDVSPKIVKFLSGLTSDNDLLDIDYLRSSGAYFDSDGHCFFVHSSGGQRGLTAQYNLFKQGRLINTTGVKQVMQGHTVKPNVTVKETIRGTHYYFPVAQPSENYWVTSPVNGGACIGKYVTRAVGTSRHVWGCAVDVLIARKDSNGVVQYWQNDLGTLARKSGLVAWAQKCGLSWGGDWSSFKDFTHYQDDISLPSSDWFNSGTSGSYSWLLRAKNEGKLPSANPPADDSDKENKKVKWLKIGFIVLASFVGCFVGFKVIKKIGGR